jgi:integrase
MRQSAPFFQPSAAGRAARDALSPTRRAKWKPVAPAHGRWVHVYRDEHKRRRREVCQQCTSEAEALAHNFEIQKRAQAIAEGREKRRLGSTSTWGEWSAHYRQTVLQRMASKGPLLSHLRRLDAAWASLPLAAITARECRQLLAAAESEGLADSSVRQLYGRARAVFARAVRERWAESNPWDDVDAPEVEAKRPVTLTHHQVAALVHHAGEWRLLLLTAVLCGLRRGELGGLRWEDVRLEEGAHGVLHVRRSWDRATTKGGKSRLIPLHPSLREVLLEAKACATGELVFPGRGGGMRNRDWKAAELVRGIAERAGVTLPEGSTLTFHALRRCFATFIAQRTRDGVALRELMGHSDLSVTVRHYIAQQDVPHLEAAVAALPDFSVRQTSTSAPAAPEGTAVKEAQKAA